MKQKLYIAGIIATLTVLLGALLKMNHWPGAGICLISGLLVVLFVFLPLALRNHYLNEGDKKNALLYVVTWLTCFVVFGSMLFKVQHWPYAGLAIIISLPFPYVVFLPVFIITTGRNKNFSIYNTVYVLFLLAGISILSAFLSLNVSKEKIDDSMSLSADYNRLEKILDQVIADNGKSSVALNIDNILETTDDYQARILGSMGLTEEQWNSNPASLPLPETAVRTNNALSADYGKLQDELEKFFAVLGKDKTADNTSTVPAIFSYRQYPGKAPYEWTRIMFSGCPVVWSLIYYDALETNLKMIKAGL